MSLNDYFEVPGDIHSCELLTDVVRQQLYQLWNTEYPVQLVYESITDFHCYLNGLQEPQHYLLYAADGNIAGWAFTFLRDGARWFGIIVAGKWQGRCIGKRLIMCLKNDNTELYGWVTDHDRYLKQDGTPYRSPVAFYEKLGFKVCKERLNIPHLSAVKIVWTP